VTDKHLPSDGVEEDVKFIKEEGMMIKSFAVLNCIPSCIGFRLLISDCPRSHEV